MRIHLAGMKLSRRQSHYNRPQETTNRVARPMCSRLTLVSQVELPFHASAAEHGPMFTQTIHYGLMRLTGDDGLTWLVQPAFLFLIFGLFHGSVRLLGGGRRLASIATALLMLHTPFYASMVVANNEIVMTCGCALFLFGMLWMPARLTRGATDRVPP